MSKLATKFRSGLARAKSASVSLGSSEKIGKTGHELIKFGTHAGLALASKNMKSVGPIPVSPDVAAGIAGAVMMAVMKSNKARGLGRSIATGAINAVISRWVYSDNFTVINGADIFPPKPAQREEEPEIVESRS